MKLEVYWEDMQSKLLDGEKKMIKNTGLYKILGQLDGVKKDFSELLLANVELILELFQLYLLFNYNFYLFIKKLKKDIKKYSIKIHYACSSSILLIRIKVYFAAMALLVVGVQAPPTIDL